MAQQLVTSLKLDNFYLFFFLIHHIIWKTKQHFIYFYVGFKSILISNICTHIHGKINDIARFSRTKVNQYEAPWFFLLLVLELVAHLECYKFFFVFSILKCIDRCIVKKIYNFTQKYIHTTHTYTYTHTQRNCNKL